MRARPLTLAWLVLAGAAARAQEPAPSPVPPVADPEAFLAAMTELEAAPLEAPGVEPGIVAAFSKERAEVVDKGRRLVEKLNTTQGQLAELRVLRAQGQKNLESSEQLPAPEPSHTTPDEVDALEQALELARYSVANRQRRLETLRADLLSVRDRLEESRLNQQQARGRVASAGDAGPGRDELERRLGEAQLQMETFRERYLELLLETRQLRNEIAEIELRVEERDLAEKVAALKALRARLGVTRDEADKHVAHIDAREKELAAWRERLEKELKESARLEREADVGLHRVQEGRPSEAELTYQRTRLDTALEQTKAATAERGRVELESDLLAFQKRSWLALAELRPQLPDAPTRDRLVRHQITEVEDARVRARDRAASVAKLVQIAQDDVSQIEEGISYSEARVTAADDMSAGAARQGMKGLDAKRALLEATVESLRLALGHARRRLAAISDEERLLDQQVEHLAETRERLDPLLAATGERITADSFRDLATAAAAALRSSASLTPTAVRRAASAYAGAEPRASALRLGAMRVLLLALLGAALAGTLRHGLSGSLPGLQGGRRAAVTFAIHGLVPAVLVAVVVAGLHPARPDLPPAADASEIAVAARAARTIVDSTIVLLLVTAVLLAVRGMTLAAQAGGLDPDAFLRWRFVLGWTDIALISWLTLRHGASVARTWGAPRSVPFLIDAVALCAALLAMAVTLLRLRPQVERALRARRSADGAATTGALAGAWNVVAHWFTHLLVLGMLSLLALHAAGYAELARLSFVRAVETFLVAAVATGVVRLSRRRLEWRMAALDRLQSATGQAHTVAREMTRLLHLALVAGALCGAAMLMLGAWGVDTREASASAREVLGIPLFSVNQTTVTPLSVASFFAIIVGAVLLSRGANRLLITKVFPRSSVDKGVQNALATIANYLILLVAFFAGFQALGFDLTTLKVIIGAVGLGIGFGLQNIAANFISGLIILLERPIKPDDVVEVSGTLGRVVAVSARATHLRTRDNVSVIVPNTDLVSGLVVNWTGRDSRLRIHVHVGVAYDTDPALLRRELMAVALANPAVLRVPEPEVRLLKFGESAMEFELLAWIEDPWPSERIKSDLYYAVEEALRKAHVRIPFPQRVLHVVSPPPKPLDPAQS